MLKIGRFGAVAVLALVAMPATASVKSGVEFGSVCFGVPHWGSKADGIRATME
jgi:hypothetical protein